MSEFEKAKGKLSFMDTVIGKMKECVNCNSKVPAEFARCPECHKPTTEVDVPVAQSGQSFPAVRPPKRLA